MSENVLDQVVDRLIATGKTIATAESCTGGLIAKQLTDLPGSSAYFTGGAVTYSYAAKRTILGVSEHMMFVHGSVSEPVARVMAQGARRVFGVDVAISVTGIAGPSGGSESKPIGLTYIGLSAAEGDWVRRFVFDGDRAQNRESSAAAALQLLLDYLDGKL
ncbi:MAG: CinA family protein [Anaerolineae bacterium]|nr:CinA family protein [Anaerolineae bacterium]